MGSLPIPTEVLRALVSENNYQLRWLDNELHERFDSLGLGPDRDTAQRLLDALPIFPPDARDFEVLDIRMALGGSGYTVDVVTNTDIRVTVSAKYRQGVRTVTILAFQIGSRSANRLKLSRTSKKGGGS
jgi:hypothetical protein